MYQLFALVGAIVLIYAVLILRAVMGMPYARHRARWVRAVAPRGVEDLFAQTTQALQALGFSAPRWVLCERADGAPTIVPLRAVCAHPDGCTAWVGMPVNQRAPHRLHVYYVSRLADGRAAISQAFDLYFAVAPTQEIIGRVATEPDVADQVAAHRAWAAGLGSVDTPLDDAAVLDQAADLLERHRTALIAQGDLRVVNDDVAVPGWRFGMRLFARVLRSPKPPDAERAIPPERLALLARVADIVRHRAPPRDVQFVLFAISVLLFVGLGALFWDLRAAITILVVVMIHELGHFLAMRAFGYRNVHLLALPLVGGVAMGLDANPSATRRAWMSLMGPLPGIVIGWGMLAMAWFGGLDATAAPWLIPAALVFLFINYLNVLPMPPLDGAHVVQALLPPRWGRVEVVFLAVAAAFGGVAAWWFGLPLLSGLAALQLLTVPHLWRTHGVEARLAREVAPSGNHAARMLRVLRELDRALGPPTQAMGRINQAFALLTRLETKPMGALSRALTGLVYVALLAFPILVGVAYYQQSRTTQVYAERAQADAAQREALRVQAQGMSLRELILAMREVDDQALPGPASTEALARAEARLGRALPEGLRTIYAQHDGVPALGLLALDDLDRVQPALIESIREFTPKLYGSSIDAPNGADVEIPLDALQNWWHIGGWEDAPVFYVPDDDARIPGQRVVVFDYEGSSIYASLHSWLAHAWLEHRMAEEYDRQRRERLTAGRARLAQHSVAELLSALRSESLLEWLMNRERAGPAPANAEQIAAAERRLGVSFPGDFKAMLAQHDGLRALQILPLADMAPWTDVAHRLSEPQRTALFEAEAPRAGEDPAYVASWREQDFETCIMVSGMRAFGGQAGEQAELAPMRLWCPEGTPQSGWLDLFVHTRHAHFRDWLIDAVARRTL